MKMKIFTALLAVFVAFQVTAQVDFGVRAGFGLFNLNAIDWDGDKVDELKLAPRFNLGVSAEFAVAENFVIQSGLLFATKGAKSEEIDIEFKSTSVSSAYTLNYIEVPIYFLYKAQMESGAFLVGAGPYFGYGIGGKYKFNYGSMSSTIDIKFANEWGDDEALYFKPFDFGFNVMAGYQLASGLSFGLNAQMGLANFYLPEPSWGIGWKSPSNDQSSIKNIGFNLFVGYKF